MKKTVLAMTLGLAAFGVISAQQWGNGRFQRETVTTVNGTLSIQNGMIAVASEGGLYFAPSLERYVGFIADLKEGAAISLEGFVSGNYIRPAALMINGRRYDLYAEGPQGGRGNRGYAGNGPCCW